MAPLTIVPAAYKEQSSAAQAPLEPARPADQMPHRGWWEQFGDTELNDLETTLMRSNPGMTQAEARFRQARALVRQDRAAYFPTITASTSIARSRPGAVTGTASRAARREPNHS